jgi:hypothetical protein
MALQVGELYASLTLRKGQFDSELNQAERKMDHTGKRFDSIFDGIRTAGLYATAGLAIGFGAAAYAGIKANSDTQQFLATMTKLTGSTSEAKKQLQELKTFAANTPFTMGDLKQGELIMRAVGLETGKWRTAIGDTAAAWKTAGKSYVDVVQAIADSQTGELERLKEFGITKQQIVDKGSQMFRNKELVNKKGQITDMTRFNEALLALMQSRYGGMMKVQSQTLSGMMSNIQDFGTSALETLSKPLFDKLNAGAQSAMESLQTLQQDGTLDVWAESIGQDVDSVISFFQSINWEVVGMAAKFIAVTAATATFAVGIRNLGLALTALVTGAGAPGLIIGSFAALIGLFSILDRETTSLSLAQIKQTQTQLQQVNANDQLINSYESLRNKTKWTNDEFLRYLDLQKMISKETDPSKIQQYKNEMQGLQKNSGLTNSQIQQLLTLNGQMIKKMPEGSQAISSQGSAVAKLADQYRKLNAEKRAELQNKLEEQKSLLIAERPALIEKIRVKQIEANKADEEALAIRRHIQRVDTEYQAEVAKLKEAQRSGYAGDIKMHQDNLMYLGMEQNQLHGALGEQIKIRDEARKQVTDAQGRLAKLQEIQNQLGQIAAIEGKTAQGQIVKNNQQIKQLQTMKEKHQGNAQQIDGQISKLQTENGQLQGTVTKSNALGNSLKKAGTQTSTNSKNQSTHNTNLNSGSKAVGGIVGALGRAGSQTKSNIASASIWNALLGKSISKTVTVKTNQIANALGGGLAGLGAMGATGSGNRGSKIKRHSGGSIPMIRVPGIGGDVPAILKGGETVLTARHTNDLIRLLENGETQGKSGNSSNINVTVNNNGGREMDESGVLREAQRAARMLSAWR